MTRKLRVLCVATLAVIAITAAGGTVSAEQTAVLRGKVVEFSEQPIAKVSVVLTSPDDPSIRLKATSNTFGLFEFAVADASLTYHLSFDRKGFVSMTAIIELSVDEANSHTFTMLTEEEIAEGKEEALRERENPEVFKALNLYNDGVAAFTGGDVDAARSLFEDALEHNPSMPEALSAMCIITMQAQEWQEAAAYAARTLAVDPSEPRALLVSYRANKKLGNDAEAATAAEALKTNGQNTDVAGQIFNEGVDAYRAHDVELAIDSFQQAAELDPTLVNAQVALAGLYLSKGDFDDALAASGRALALAPTNATALKYRFEASLRSEADVLPDALEAMAAVDLPYVSKAVTNEALVLFEGNRYEQSRKLIEQLLALDPGDPRANYVMGLLLFNAGDRDAAREHLQVFVDAAPDDPDAASARTMIEAVD